LQARRHHPTSTATRCRQRQAVNRLISRLAAEVLVAHLAQQQHLAGQATQQRSATVERGLAQRARHRRASARIGRTGRELGVDQAGARAEIVPHAAIDDRQRQAVLARQHRDGRATGEKVLDHLPGHVARVGRDAARGDAVVGREDDQLRRVEPRCSVP
jgi:hypothetical protein